jgi:hypothetical protein
MSPILICGEGRSGTTILSVLLDANPNFSAAPELHFRVPINLGEYILDMLSLKCDLNEKDWNDLRRDKLRSHGFHFVNRVLRWGISTEQLIEIIKRHIGRGSRLTSFSERCELVKELGLLRSQVYGGERKNWGFKIMRDLILYKNYIAEWPSAKFIHIVRDPRDMYASQSRDHATWGYRTPQDASSGWNKMVELVQTLEGFDSISFVEIKYEDLIIDTEKVLRRLCDFIGIAWSENMLDHVNQDSVFLKNSHDHPSGNQVKKSLYFSSIGRHKMDLLGSERDAIEHECNFHMQRLGYLC